MDQLERTLAELRRSVERRVQLKINRPSPPPLHDLTPLSSRSPVDETGKLPPLTAPSERAESGLWARLGELAFGRFRR